MLRSCCGRHPLSDPGVIEAAEQPSASEGGVASSLHSREKRPMATRGRRSLEAALANHRGGIGKSNRSELLIGWPAARGLSFFPEPPSVFVGVWSAEGVRFPPGMRLCEPGSCSQSPQKSRLGGNLRLSERIYLVLQMVRVKHWQVFWTGADRKRFILLFPYRYR